VKQTTPNNPNLRHMAQEQSWGCAAYRREVGLIVSDIPWKVLPNEEDLAMCGRYARRSDKQKIAEYFAVHGPSLPDFGPSWNVAPQTFQPVIRLNRDTGAREIVLMRWGLIPFWAKDPKMGLRTINAKAETITTAPAFREAIKYRRCLVPAAAFYEWQKLDAKTKQPFAIAMKDGNPYALAGLGSGGRIAKPGLSCSRLR
jgi:putative SOS response-associated peptidase YedK